MFKSDVTKSDVLKGILIFGVAFFILWIISSGPDYQSKYESLSDDYRMLEEEYQLLEQKSEERISESYAEGFNSGKDIGSEGGYDSGYSDGYFDAYYEGYYDGYEDGTHDDDMCFQIMGDWPIWLWEDERFQESFGEALRCFWEGNEPEDISGPASSFYSMIVDCYNDWR